MGDPTVHTIAKKRKRLNDTSTSNPSNHLNNSKISPIPITNPTLNGRNYTLSVALPSSILNTAPSNDLRTHLAGQLARALAIFSVDEIVLFSDGTPPPKSTTQLSHILSYLETPPYLRKHLFPLHEDLRSVGLLPSLDIPSHVRADEEPPFREAVTLRNLNGQTTCDAGLGKEVLVDSVIPEKTRVTLRMPEGVGEEEYIFAETVTPGTPCLERGFYWGYRVREASSISTVFTESPLDGGYDLTFGISETGVSLDDLIYSTHTCGAVSIPPFHHMLIVLGDRGELDAAVKADQGLRELGVEDSKDLFDYWVNVCPDKGSRVIRTEEALWIALAGLRRVVLKGGISHRVAGGVGI